jgi:hypothetical protein
MSRRALLVTVLIALAVIPHRPASALDMCPTPDHVKYRILLDGGLARAMNGDTNGDVVVRALTAQLPCDIEGLHACLSGASAECPTPPDAWACPSRAPNGSEFSDQEIRNLADSRIVLEEFIQVRPNTDGDHVLFNYFLVPVAAGKDSVLKGTSVLMKSERVVAGHAKLDQAMRALNQGSELKALAFLCSGTRHLAIPDYHGAFQDLTAARQALLEIKSSSRRDAMRDTDKLLRSLIRAAYDRARADKDHPSDLARMTEEELESGALRNPL